MRPGLFALTGIAFFAYWALAHPSFEATASQSEWPMALWFSATLAVLAVALPVFGRMVGGRWVVRLALLAGAGHGLYRLLAFVPAVTALGLLLFVIAGGVVMLATWLAAAAAAARLNPRPAVA